MVIRMNHSHIQFTKNNVPVSKCLETLIWKTEGKNPEKYKERERVKMSQNESTVVYTASKPLCFYFKV